MTEYVETEVKPGDTRSDVLETLAGGHPFVFVWVIIDPESGGLDLKAEVGGGIADSQTARSLLQRAINAMPAGGE